MDGLYYALSIVGIFLIILWFVRNDRQEETRGLLAMRKEHTGHE